MNFSLPFIRRPIGTTLLAVGLFLVGVAAYRQLPVASLPTIEFPVVRVNASRPGADPATMAATVAAPIERRLAEIAGVTELTSVSQLGSTNISVQFDLNRNIEGAARDVQAALNAAAADLPTDLPTLPVARKMNPAAAPVLILALTSDTVTPAAIYDAADSVVAQRIFQIAGVADVNVSGAAQPAIRIRLNPGRLAALGVSLDDVRTAIVNANAVGPLGAMDGQTQAKTISVNDQLRVPSDYNPIVVKTASGAVVRLSDIATVGEGVRTMRSDARFNNQPSVLLIITKQATANVVETVDRVKALIPEIEKWIPAGIKISILSDRTQTIRASIGDMQITLAVTVVLVMLVVLLFLRRGAATLAAGITVPLSLAGTCAAMWAVGYSIDNLSLMALAIAVGFVVDDAIVMIENTFRNLEAGMTPLQSSIAGARQIGFTVISISISLIAAFIPLLFLGGVVGRLLREFSVTLTFAILISTVVSLTVTPMICAHFVRSAPSPDATRIDRLVEGALTAMVAFYGRTLQKVLNNFALMLFVMAATVAITVQLYIKTPKGYFPQDDTGLVMAMTEASVDISYRAMSALQQQALGTVLEDPAVSGVGSSIGASAFGGALNQGRMFISLKPLAERGGVPTPQVVDRLRRRLGKVVGLRVFMVQAQDLRSGARSGKAQYQYTLWGTDIGELQDAVQKVLPKLRGVPGLLDVSTDRDQGGLQANLIIDRASASRLGVQIQSIDAALNNAFSERQIATFYGARNQYQTILEVEPDMQKSPSDLGRIYVPGAGGTQVPLSAVTSVQKSTAPLVVNHQGQFPSITITFNLAPDMSIDTGMRAVQTAIDELSLPDSIHAEAAGDAKAFQQSAGAQPLLILAALIAVYIVLGVLYESLAHPLTIISTLPSAGLGALLALQISGLELTVIAVIGIILLIGIVKKNGIMLVDFALEAERKRGLDARHAIYEACMERFRPILMTTLAALLGAVPLAIASGPGSELRRPLGITILGGLVVSQILTLYTTPVIYLLLDKLHNLRRGRRDSDRRWPRRSDSDSG